MVRSTSEETLPMTMAMAAEVHNQVASTADREPKQQFNFSPPQSHNNYHHAHRQSHNPSKLPAFRFADLRKDTLALPSLLTQNHGIPPSPVSPGMDPDPAKPPPDETTPDTTRTSPPPQPPPQHNKQHSKTVSPEPSSTALVVSPEISPDKSRDTSSQTPSKTAAVSPQPDPSRSILDLASTSSKPDDLESPLDSATTIVPATSQQRRAPSRSDSNTGHRARQSSEDSQTGTPTDEGAREWTPGRRELLLPKTIQKTDANDKRSSVARRPPVSYRPPLATSNSTGGSTSIPPIRSFRSSGDRRSLSNDMNLRSPSVYEDGFNDANHRDDTLKALEGRRDETSQLTPPDSAVDRSDVDDTGDVFLKMAHEEPETQTAVSRVVRSSHRRPLSSIIPSYQPMSPPQISRRLSDQESSRSRVGGEESSRDRIARMLNYRGLTKQRPADDTRSVVSTSRTSPITPRSLTFQDSSADTGSAHSRRRSINDSSSGGPARLSSLKQSGMSAYSHGRSHNPSPLVPKSTDHQRQDGHPSDHHTESSASTAAPSTVWDELDDLKSRMRRLELTGKIPPTSGAAISRASEDRPPTATTNATTMSGSPKRGSGSTGPHTDAVSTVSSTTQKDGQPLLQSAINKSKPFLSPEIHSALEAAAADAMMMTAMIGKIGEPGPVSSAASSIGGPAVTDRQLRRKAEGICRSLTELCLALSENVAQIKQQEAAAPAPEKELVSSPTITRFSGLAAQRRPSAALVDRSPASVAVSPRAMSRLEERRNSMLQSSALPTASARHTSSIPPTPTDIAGRRTSLMLPRTRRAGTEEPEDQASGRRSSLLRTRRAGTEEPEEPTGRRSSLLRTRRGTVEHDDDEPTSRFRAPSRAATEVGFHRSSASREHNAQMPIPSIETGGQNASALPRRRLPSSTINTRLVQPSAPSSLTTRRYFERTPDREANHFTERLAEDRGQRQPALAQNSRLARASSLNKRNRDSALISNPPTSYTGAYR